MAGRAQELKEEKITIGRAEDNTFQVVEASVSSHHCEVRLRGSDVLVRDLDSTNGTYIGGEKITERVLKPGQIVRLGQVDLRLEADAAGAPPKKHFDRTTIIAGGVKASELDHALGGGGFDTKGAGFSKKSNRVNQIFIIIGVVLGLVILGLLIYIAATIRK
jgi:hypothetical protein